MSFSLQWDYSALKRITKCKNKLDFCDHHTDQLQGKPLNVVGVFLFCFSNVLHKVYAKPKKKSIFLWHGLRLSVETWAPLRVSDRSVWWLLSLWSSPACKMLVRVWTKWQSSQRLTGRGISLNKALMQVGALCPGFQNFGEFSPKCFVCVPTYYFILGIYKLYCLFE